MMQSFKHFRFTVGSDVIIDIETAFLNGELTEEIYMMTPEGLEAREDECVLLDKAIYGFSAKCLNVLSQVQSGDDQA
jgi:Reverse transcriptase (RNA-dependent DNA polymerase)